jgi:hypothetical protein
MFEHWRAITIEWGGCDPAGIAYFPRYLAMLDSCTWGLFTAARGMKKGLCLPIPARSAARWSTCVPWITRLSAPRTTNE